MNTINLFGLLRHNSCSRYLIAGIVLSLAWQCAGERSGSRIQLVAIDADTTLEVIDWGGSGVPVIFLAGLGHTAHVFDEFASGLTNSYRVIGITRRGFGASSQPDSGYTIPTLTEDIRTVLDSLGIEQAVLVGHSLGGDEMTHFAPAHPGKVKALVYIEAAYNRASAQALMAGLVAPESESPAPTEKDTESTEAFRAYYAKVSGVTMPLSEIKAINHWAPDGRRIGSVTPSSIYTWIRESIQDPEYSKIDVPALAIYGTNYPITELFIDYDLRDSTTQCAMRAYHEVALRTDAFSRDFFKTHMANGRILEINGAGHSLYITHAKETLAAIRAFLAEVL